MITAESEIFVPIKGYENIYEISNAGRVRSYARGKPQYKKSWKRYRNYMCVGLWKDNKSKFVSVHRLVAEAFIPNPKNKPCVNHKDLDPTNNQVDNLEWVTHSENEQHAYLNGKVPWNKGKAKYIEAVCENCGIKYRRYCYSGRKYHNWECYLSATGKQPSNQKAGLLK